MRLTNIIMSTVGLLSMLYTANIIAAESRVFSASGCVLAQNTSANRTTIVRDTNRIVNISRTRYVDVLCPIVQDYIYRLDERLDPGFLDGYFHIEKDILFSNSLHASIPLKRSVRIYYRKRNSAPSNASVRCKLNQYHSTSSSSKKVSSKVVSSKSYGINSLFIRDTISLPVRYSNSIDYTFILSCRLPPKTDLYSYKVNSY